MMVSTIVRAHSMSASISSEAAEVEDRFKGFADHALPVNLVLWEGMPESSAR